jgi:hypothetical protein
MGTTVIFKPQKKTLALLKNGAKHILLFGGSRPGKTTVLVMAIIYRALRFTGSRHLICRYRVKDVRSSVPRETLLPWLDNIIGKSGYTYLAHESMVTLLNDSEIRIDGLGDREQADKILGPEYNTIYFNEVSQLNYMAVTTAYSRQNLTNYDNFSIFKTKPLYGDSYSYNARVNILIRNIARADFVIKREGNNVKTGPLYDLFRRPNAALSRYDLWKETATWRHIEGEARDRRSLGWFGPDYAGGLPKELYILNPRKLQHEGKSFGALKNNFKNNTRRWFYHADTELIPIFSKQRGKDTKPWGDTWYRPKNMIPTSDCGTGSDTP